MHTRELLTLRAPTHAALIVAIHEATHGSSFHVVALWQDEASGEWVATVKKQEPSPR